MTVLATICLLSLAHAAAPQGDGQDPTAAAKAAPLLSGAEQSGLHDKLVKYLEATEGYDAASGLRDRERAGKAREKAKEAFEKEWDRLGKKGNLIASMADMRAIFANCFTVKAPPYTGSFREQEVKGEGAKYGLYIPKAYKPETPVRTVVVLPGPSGTDEWQKPVDCFNATWDKTAATADTAFHVVDLPKRIKMDPVPEFGREGADIDEQKRITSIWMGLGQTMGTVLNVDRNHVFLDCGKDTCSFGLRFASIFPDRFAGLILREPAKSTDIRLGSLVGLPILLLKTEATAAAVDKLKGELDAVSPGSVTVIDASDAFPHKGAADAISEWMGKQTRVMTPRRVVIEPNHDQFNRAYWVDIDRAAPLANAENANRPRIEVEADRAQNRITVKTRGIDSFVLNLNDDLVDLDKEFTVVINDKATVEKKTRSFNEMRDGMARRRDWEYLYPVTYSSLVPK